jgi:hypothetical protein
MGTGEILSTGSVTNLAGLIEKCNFPQDAFLLAEQLPSNIIKQEQRQDLLLFVRLGTLENLEKTQDYTSGRIFSEAFELRWEKESRGDYQVVYFGPDREISGLTRRYELRKEKESNEHYQVIYFGPEHEISGLDGDEQEPKNIERYKVDTKQYYLFGEHLEATQLQDMKIGPADEGNSYYATVRIPRLLSYPISSGARRVQLVVREYLDETTGRVRLFRFRDLVDAVEKRGEAKA